MASSRNRPLTIVVWLARLALGGIFVYAAWTKLRDPWLLFAMSIDNYKVLPQWAVLVVARTLPWFELALGLMLMIGRLPRVSSTAASALLGLFFGLMVRAYAQGNKIDCGCFGPGEAISPLTLARDGSVLAGALFLLVMSLLRRKPRPGPVEPAAVADLAEARERASS